MFEGILMAEKKRRREAFFKKHPKCCFCGGERDAVEIDHQPPKTFFTLKDKFPQELRFPTCSQCNRNSRLLDPLLGYWTSFSPGGSFAPQGEEFRKMMEHFVNNSHPLMPFMISNSDKRNFARKHGLKKLAGITWDEFPVIGGDRNVLDALNLSIAKLGVALFYHLEKSIPQVGAKIKVYKDINVSLGGSDIAEKFGVKEIGLYYPLTNGAQQKDFGFNLRDDSENALVAVLIGLKNSIFASVVIAEPSYVDEEIEGIKIDFDYVVTREGFPWGTDLNKLLAGSSSGNPYRK